ncbi:MAG: hypothetical protein VX460_05395, partial [Planctomycetota bacterium]|nr:hypothetical protein [Planctomycetota bacterium]
MSERAPTLARDAASPEGPPGANIAAFLPWRAPRMPAAPAVVAPARRTRDGGCRASYAALGAGGTR